MQKLFTAQSIIQCARIGGKSRAMATSSVSSVSTSNWVNKHLMECAQNREAIKSQS